MPDLTAGKSVSPQGFPDTEKRIHCSDKGYIGSKRHAATTDDKIKHMTDR